MQIFRRLSTENFKSSDFSIWELSDLEYFTHVLVDYQHFEDQKLKKHGSTLLDSTSDEEENTVGFTSSNKPGLYDYIDSIGKVRIERDDRPSVTRMPRMSRVSSMTS